MILTQKHKMTQELYQRAMKFAGEKHSCQKVPGTNANYLLHISNVAMEVLVAYNVEPSFEIDFAIQAAILHDTIEDTTTTFEEIKEKFGNKIAEAVQALTKNQDLDTTRDRIADSLKRINQLPKEVGIVKLADRITNLQIPPKHWNKEKIMAYCMDARLIHKELHGKNNFLHSRLKNKIEEYSAFIDRI